ncbi:16S rRNA (guanine(966)-N(2))-methyltransferase RsmD [Rhizosaccharibacter radicis]|uniref:16S rRNA (Guanine(966)-N(2))-methyltransferase RsmD n=1 Tax=Rhizosaccharibacter radicis TaxID=2782605 RepID=A0ABT1VVE2_9PROT|nr:16S rRNA (guanine(966)-N(2))-methyltransferase RsmD [Acetobacteraceae bacterium KSS12]
MRIVAGAFRGRALSAPPGTGTRPTADRVRQALFDMLRHADWAADARGAALEGPVLDGFAGTGALGLEALSRGASRAVFMERDRTALAALGTNIRACRCEERALVMAADMSRPPPARAGWNGIRLLFLDPPYNRGLVAPAIAALREGGWLDPAVLVVAEVGAAEPPPTEAPLLMDRAHGAARLCAWRPTA